MALIKADFHLRLSHSQDHNLNYMCANDVVKIGVVSRVITLMELELEETERFRLVPIPLMTLSLMIQ